MTRRQINYTKKVHLWDDGNWYERGGHWIAVPDWHWDLVQKLLIERGLRGVLAKRMLKALKEG